MKIKDNFLDLYELNSKADGWEIYKDNELLCLKSPIDCPKLQLCFGIKYKEDLKKAYDFYEGKSFAYFAPESEKIDFSLEYDFEIPLVEMFLKKEDFKKLNSNEKVRIEIVETPEEVKLWSRLDSEIENMKYQDVYDFMSVSSKNHGAKCIIAYLDEIAVGVAHYFVDTHKLGLISSVGVLENYRKQNIGSSIMNKSIENLFNISKGEIAALYSFVGAQDFYKKLGFVKKQIWNFYILKSIGG